MSTPESTSETSGLDATARAENTASSESTGTPVAASSADLKTPWWKRLLGRG